MTEIRLFTQLSTLDKYSGFSKGNIPSEFSLLTDLTYLDLGWNELTGTLPSELGLSTQLTYLGLYKNLLSSIIPPALDNLTRLGPVPPEFAQLTGIKNLILNSNEVSGSIPSNFVCDKIF